MQSNDTRIWFNHRTGETIECRYHYDCKVIVEMIDKMGKMNFFRDGWCRIGAYDQVGRTVGIVEGYDGIAIKKSLDLLLSHRRIDTIITERHDGNGYDMNIFENPLKENIDGI